MTEIIEAPQRSPETPTPRTIDQLQVDSARIERALTPDLRFDGIRTAEEQNAKAIIEAFTTGTISKDEAARIVANRQTELILAAGEDELTELKSRAGFEEAMTIAVNLDRRNNKPTVIAFLDLDGFKAANDTAGHETGDQILIAVGGLVSEELTRASDIGARFGGDEYALGFPSSNLKTANEKIFRILQAIPSTASGIAEELDKPLSEEVTGSVGVIEASHDPSDKRSTRQVVQEMLRQADGAMYVAKYLGKNTIVNVIDRGNGELHFLDVKRGVYYELIKDDEGKIIRAEPYING